MYGEISVPSTQFCCKPKTALKKSLLKKKKRGVSPAQTVKNPPAMQETQVQYLGREDPLGKKMATQSSVLSGQFHGQRTLAGYSPGGLAVNSCRAYKAEAAGGVNEAQVGTQDLPSLPSTVWS